MLLWLLLISSVLVFASIWCEPDAGASMMYELFRALAGMAGMVVWYYYGRRGARKRTAHVRELRVEAQLRIEQRDGTRRP